MKSTYIKRNGHERTRITYKNLKGLPLKRRQRALKRIEKLLQDGGYIVDKQFIKLTDERKINLQKEILNVKTKL